MVDDAHYYNILEAARLLHIGESKLRSAIVALEIELKTLNLDRRMRYLSGTDIDRVRAWLHKPENAVE